LNGKGEAALEAINRAIDGAGPSPSLLDTRAVVYVYQSRSEPAIKDLEEALATGHQPGVYFHLAQALELARKHSAAGEALRQARRLNLRPSSLHPVERRPYQRLLAQLTGRQVEGGQ